MEYSIGYKNDSKCVEDCPSPLVPNNVSFDCDPSSISMSPTSSNNEPATTSATNPSVNTTLAFLIPFLVVFILLIEVLGILITLYRWKIQRNRHYYEEDVYYSTMTELSSVLPIRNTLHEQNITEPNPLYCTITNIQETTLCSHTDDDIPNVQNSHDPPMDGVTATTDIQPSNYVEILSPDVETEANRNCSDSYDTESGETTTTIPETDINPAYVARDAHVELQENIAYDNGQSILEETIGTTPLVENPAYGTNIAIAPGVETEENVAYCSNAQFSPEFSDENIAENPAYGADILAAIVPGVDMDENIAYCSNAQFSSEFNDETDIAENPAYGADILAAIAPGVEMEENVAYCSSTTQFSSE